MDIGTLLSTLVTVFAACGAALLGVGCVWPSDLPRRRTPRTLLNNAGCRPGPAGRFEENVWVQG
ncbi:hypothetical protein U8260_24140, partial [Nocardia sp. CDC192]